MSPSVAASESSDGQEIYDLIPSPEESPASTVLLQEPIHSL